MHLVDSETRKCIDDVGNAFISKTPNLGEQTLHTSLI
jgi:hypothetical protein